MRVRRPPREVNLDCLSCKATVTAERLAERRNPDGTVTAWYLCSCCAKIATITSTPLSMSPQAQCTHFDVRGLQIAPIVERFTRVAAFITLTLLLPAAAFAQTGGSVSVRPFTNITGEPGDAWIGAAIAETLIADLLGAPGFEVVTGEQIGAPWVVSGAYQRVGNQIRITARLVEVASGAVIRPATVDGSLDDLFGLQDRLAMDLVGRSEIPASRLAARPPAAAPSAAPAASPPLAPPAPERAPAAPAQVGTGAAAADTYGPVTATNTLWSLAERFRPDETMSVQRMMLALLEANPDAFTIQNVNALKMGAVLRIPTREEIDPDAKAEALAEVRTQHAAWDTYRTNLIGHVSPAPQGAASPAPAPAEPQ